MIDEALDGKGARRLEGFFDSIGQILNDSRRKASFAMYMTGLLLDGDRKSVEPIAARLCGDAEDTKRAHDRLLHFTADGKWSDRDVRRFVARYGLAAMTAENPVMHWIIDDTGFLKQGRHSVGVQRQYTGSAGKTANCQVGVSLCLATKTAHMPVDFDLYLPESWIGDQARRAEARIPDDVVFRTKPEIALEQIDRALEDGLPKGVVLVDSAYGNSSEFRDGVRLRGLDYAVGVHGTTNVWRIDSHGQRKGDGQTIRDIALALPRSRYRRTTWRDGTRGPLWSRFAQLRVVPCHDDGWPEEIREEVTLLIEWPDGEREPTDYTFSTLPKNTARKKLVRTVKERYRTERMYEDLKGELGLDHYEGRRYRGWNHHVTCVMACYAFVLGERVRRFPPSARRKTQTSSHRLAA